MKLGSAHRARQQQPEKAALDQCLDHMFGQPALRLDLVGGICEQRRQIAGAFDIVGAARLGGGQIKLDRRHLFLRLPAAAG